MLIDIRPQLNQKLQVAWASPWSNSLAKFVEVKRSHVRDCEQSMF